MPYVKSINWVQNYRGFIGALSDKDADNWANVIRTNIPGLKAHEVDNAVASICADWQGGSNKPNAMSIIKRITEQRRLQQTDVPCDSVASYYNHAEEPPVLSHRLMSDLMIDLEYAADNPAEAWSIICLPLDVVQCHALKAHADKKGIKYNRHVGSLEQAWDKLINSKKMEVYA